MQVLTRGHSNNNKTINGGEWEKHDVFMCRLVDESVGLLCVFPQNCFLLSAGIIIGMPNDSVDVYRSNLPRTDILILIRRYLIKYGFTHT